MRVSLVTHYLLPDDAVGHNVVEKARFFLRRGDEVRVFYSHMQEEPVPPDCPAPAYAVEWQHLVGSEPHRVHSDFYSSSDLVIIDYPVLYPLLEGLVGRWPPNAHVILDYHGVTPPQLWDFCPLDVLAGNSSKHVVWTADAAVAHSQYMCNELSTETQYPRELVLELPYVVDPSRFRSDAASGADPIASLGLGDTYILLYVGRVAGNKRVDTLVHALKYLGDLDKPVHAVIAGSKTGIFAAYAQGCLKLARELGVSDRVHLIGAVEHSRLPQYYRRADAFVMPSLHEGFCIPVVEAMGCGTPVIAARTTALPQTVGDAGLSFWPEDPKHLASQVRRVLTAHGVVKERRGRSRKLNVALVSYRYGVGFAGGAELQMRKIANCLQETGHQVEVFTTCNLDDVDFKDSLQPGTEILEGVPVHRFPIDDRVFQTYVDSLSRINLYDCDLEDERGYLQNGICSTALVKAVEARIDELDAIIVGPYLFGITYQVAEAFPEKTLVLGCFHEEPLAYLRSFHRTYGRSGGFLFNSAEEGELVLQGLGINHPNVGVIGSYMDPVASAKGNFRAQRPGSRPYLLYVGRYNPAKRIDLVIDYARRYQSRYPDRFDFLFMGHGEVQIPKEPGFVDLGFRPEEEKAAIIADAAAVLQLSTVESFSFVLMEAWLNAVPVIGNAQCPVIAGHIRRSGGGAVIGDYDSFEDALGQLHDRPGLWMRAGERGRQYVRHNYTSKKNFAQRVVDRINAMGLPVASQIRRKAASRALRFTRNAWEKRMEEILDRVLVRPVREGCDLVELTAETPVAVCVEGQGLGTISVRVTNRSERGLSSVGFHPVLLSYHLYSAAGKLVEFEGLRTPLPRTLPPGETCLVDLCVQSPLPAGQYRLVVDVVRERVGWLSNSGSEPLYLSLRILKSKEALARYS
ncbi:MAG: glycosyltransferase [Acidobacteria bacterium]|nr:MAG: glycosyltransferase [Acidobacteriota bacterium]